MHSPLPTPGVVRGGTQERGLEMNAKLSIVRYESDPLISVYRGIEHMGLVFPPIAGLTTKYEALPNSLDRQLFDNEQDAIDHVSQN